MKTEETILSFPLFSFIDLNTGHKESLIPHYLADKERSVTGKLG
jgi:hypothetical protein